MGSDEFRSPFKIVCALCLQSDENEITGALSSKENISAHQNCLLFASGIYCKNSPTYDDLFGFDVEDVKNEQKRGKRLTCHLCSKVGATAGCELKRCKRSYHYPCAIEDHARAIEDISTSSYILYCSLHDPESKGTNPVSGPSDANIREKVDSKKRKLDRNESGLSTGSSEAGTSKKKKKSISFLDFVNDIDFMFAPVESDLEECTPPKQHNQSTPTRPCEELNPSATGSLIRGSRSDRETWGSADRPAELSGRQSVEDSPKDSPEVETPRRKKVQSLVYSDDESANMESAVTSKISLPERSTSVPEKTRSCEKLNPSSTEADDDTDIDLEESQSLLPSETYHVTVPMKIIVDSELSVESDNSLEPPLAFPPSPGTFAAPEHEETPFTSRTSPLPGAPTIDAAAPNQNRDTTGQQPKASPPSADRGVHSPVNSRSNAAVFWTRCNQVGWTKEIFSMLVSKMSSLGERVQSMNASHQDYDVALKILEASGLLPCIFTQLEQDLENQEQDLQRKKTALSDAKVALGSLI